MENKKDKMIIKKDKKIFYERDNCRLCGKKDLESVIQLTPTPSGDAYVIPGKVNKVEEVFPLDLDLCTKCGFLQLKEVVNPKLLYAPYLYFTSDSLGLIEHFDKYSKQALQKTMANAGGLVIDIGSNDGTLLNSFKNNGMRTLGIEPSERATEKARERNIETTQGFFNLNLEERVK